MRGLFLKKKLLFSLSLSLLRRLPNTNLNGSAAVLDECTFLFHLILRAKDDFLFLFFKLPRLNDRET